MLNPAIKVTSHSEIEGAGLVAAETIPTGEVLFRFDSPDGPAHQHDLVYLSSEDRTEFLMYACQIGDDEFCFRQGDIRNINHSCDPTAWWQEGGILIARRDIQPGEEVTYDYSTTDIQLNYRMPCRCGTAACRGIVTEQDHLHPAFQKKYAGHLLPHVMASIQRARNNEPDPRKPDLLRVPAEILETTRHTLSQVDSFRARYGQSHIFEMIRHTILLLQSGNRTARPVPPAERRYDDKYIYLTVRQLILQSLAQMNRNSPHG